jgi:phenylacetic acid degradation operon negative regulatory protein
MRRSLRRLSFTVDRCNIARMAPSPKSLILDLLATLPGSPGSAMPVRALVEAGGIFGLAENSVRVALARLLAQGRVQRDERGRYRAGEAVAAVSGEIRSWRRLSERTVPWTGGWIGVHAAPPGGTRAAAARSEQALRLLGFRPLTRVLRIRPDNLAGGVPAVRDRLAALGLAPGSLVTGVSDLDPATEARARTLWSFRALADAQRAGCEALAASRRALADASVEERMRETFRVGGEMIRLLVLDPLLPAEIAPADAREALLAAMNDYDDFGRACWAQFMERHGAPHRRGTPADLRVGEGAERLDRVAGR